ETAAMNRRLIFGELVHPDRRIVAAHELGVRVAARAHLWNPFVRKLADVSPSRVHGIDTLARRVATMACGAAESLLPMNVVGEQRHWRAETLVVQPAVTRSTGVRRGGGHGWILFPAEDRSTPAAKQ